MSVNSFSSSSSSSSSSSYSLSRSEFNELSSDKRRRLIVEGERKIAKDSTSSKSKPVDTLIADGVMVIFSFLNGKDLGACCSVLKEWDQLVKEDTKHTLWNAVILREIAFGKVKWNKYFGNIRNEPPLPKNIYEILKSPCPVFEGKQIGQTHMLVLIPISINQVGLSLNHLGNIVQNPKEGNETELGGYDEIFQEHGKKRMASHWVLMTKEILPGSKFQNYENQMKRIQVLSIQAFAEYRFPKALEAAICILTKYVEKGIFFGDVFTRCQDTTENFHVCVGGFSDLDGLLIIDDSNAFDEREYGIAPLRVLK